MVRISLCWRLGNMGGGRLYDSRRTLEETI